MLVFVDESGDTGFKFSLHSSRFFTLSVVVFADEDQADQVRRRIDALRDELRLPDIEFHFGKNKGSIRKAFLSAVRHYNFTAFVVVVDKTRLSPGEYQDRGEFYKSVCGVAFEAARHTLEGAKILFDEGGGRKFKTEMAAYLKRRINGPEREHIRQVKTAASTTDNLLQLADYVAGVVARAFEEGDTAYQALLGERVVVWLWPE